MLVNEALVFKGELSITLFDQAGNIKQAMTVPNLVVTAGKNHIASRMVGVADAVMSNMAIGTSSTTPVVGDTTLTAEVGRVVMSSYTATGNAVSASALFGTGVGTGTIQEAGIFNAGTAGTMLCHTTFPAVAKAAGDTLAISWTITIS